MTSGFRQFAGNIVSKVNSKKYNMFDQFFFLFLQGQDGRNQKFPTYDKFEKDFIGVSVLCLSKLNTNWYDINMVGSKHNWRKLWW